jgi:uncharacterized membrane protein
MSGMVWVRETLTTGEPYPEYSSGHTIGLQVAGYFAIEPPLGYPIKYIVCDGFSCGKQEVDEKIGPVLLNVFTSGAKLTFGRKAIPLYSMWRQ